MSDRDDILEEIAINKDKIAELEAKFIADEHTLLHIRENDDRIGKLEDASNCQLWGVCENQWAEIEKLENRIIGLDTSLGIHLKADQDYKLEKRIEKLEDLIQSIGTKLDFTSAESSQALREIEELKQKLEGEKSKPSSYKMKFQLDPSILEEKPSEPNRLLITCPKCNHKWLIKAKRLNEE
ncbi:MAG: hypothetical protein ACFFDN_47675 [Candidatus Hodarchaeota archaeon]